MTKSRHAPHALPIIAVWVLACAPEPGASHDQHVEISLENDAREVCAGSVAHLDRYINRAFNFFGIAAPAPLGVPVLVVGTESPCADLYSSSSCYVAGEETVYLADLDLEGRRTLGVVRHELSHAVIDRVWGQSAPFFNEGLAESLSQTLDRATPPALAPVGAMLDRIPAEVDYTAAAYFVRFLIDTRGLERFKQVFQQSLGHSRAEIEALMASIYGESFQALEAEYLSGPARCQYQLERLRAGVRHRGGRPLPPHARRRVRRPRLLRQRGRRRPRHRRAADDRDRSRGDLSPADRLRRAAALDGISALSGRVDPLR
ncbi:hypothetical protein [Nannocystis pusilla]|uniref:hypothetical protein n=1 Tax=Nannocystis pusilla TaxID=889268 RepID=UPI003DA3E977